MKAVILFCVVVAATGLNAQNAHLTPEQKAIVKAKTAECIKQTDVSMEVLANAKKGSFPDDENLKKFIVCFFKKTGIIGEDGQISVSTALEKLPEGIDKVEAEKILTECKTKTGKDADDTIFEVFKCYSQGTKQHVIFE